MGPLSLHECIFEDLFYFLATFNFSAVTDMFEMFTCYLFLPSIFCCFGKVYGWMDGWVAGWIDGIIFLFGDWTAVPVCSEASCVSAVFGCWQQRQAGKMGVRRDDMWQRLHARLAGTQYACESSKPPRHHQTPRFIALATAPAPKGIAWTSLQDRCRTSDIFPLSQQHFLSPLSCLLVYTDILEAWILYAWQCVQSDLVNHKAELYFQTVEQIDTQHSHRCLIGFKHEQVKH